VAPWTLQWLQRLLSQELFQLLDKIFVLVDQSILGFFLCKILVSGISLSNVEMINH
jgi:hypothetical protein